MDLPPSYEEAIKQAPNPFDTSSGMNFYQQVLTQQMVPGYCADNILLEKRLSAAFLSDPSPIIGYACQWLPNSLTDSLTAV